MRFGPTGSAAYGKGGVFVDGATPAALSGLTVQLPDWLTTGKLIYVDGNSGAGPWTIDSLTLPATIANVDSDTAVVLGAGANIWASWEPGTGLQSSVAGVTSATKYLLDVSRDGQIAVLDNYAGGYGLTVYNLTGSVVYSDAAAVPYLGTVRINDGYLAYQDAAGWHLINLSTDETPRWRPRIDGVTQMCPVTIGARLYVVEVSTNVTVREANRGKAWELRATPDAFGLDALNLSNVIRAGACTNGSETADSLVIWNATVSTGGQISRQIGTVSGGAVVYGSSSSVSDTEVSVGEWEGGTLVNDTKIPLDHPVTEIQDGKPLMTRPWAAFMQDIDRKLSGLGDVVQETPVPPPSGGDFDTVASTGQPSLMARPGMTTLNLESSDASVGIVLNPATNNADLTVQGGSWIPLVDGSEPPNFITDGAGHLILVAYP